MTSLSWPCFFICSLFVSFTLDAGHCSELLQTPHDQFDERLLIKPLPNGQVLAQFDFTTLLQVDPLHLHWGKFFFLFLNKFENLLCLPLCLVRHFRLFPSSIARLITENEVQELHFSLTKGFWKADLWGYPIKSRSSGAELNVWFTNWAKK